MLCIGISTMNDGIYRVLEAAEQLPIEIGLVVCHQTTNKVNYDDIHHELAAKKNNIALIKKNESGLSKSRNILLKAAHENGFDYILISDDDVKFRAEEILKLSYYLLCHPSENVSYWLRSVTNELELRKKYPRHEDKVSRRDLFRIASIELCINVNFVIDNQMRFDEDFGLGAKYKAGEEPIFISDCISNGMQFKHLYFSPAIHPVDGSGFAVNIDLGLMSDRLFIFKRMFGFCVGLALFIVFFLKKKLTKKTSLSFISVFRLAAMKLNEKL